MSGKRLLQMILILVSCLSAIVWASAAPNNWPVSTDAYPNSEHQDRTSLDKPKDQKSQLDPLAPSEQGDIVINEVLFYPAGGEYEWVELLNTGSDPVLINGFGITDEDDNWYTVPSALPAVPSGAFVVVIFDGLGSGIDDYDFSDNVATLHTSSGLVDIFEDDTDQVGLYRVLSSPAAYLPLIVDNLSIYNPPLPGTSGDFPESDLVGFVAWGDEPGEDAEEASSASLWSESWYVSIHRGLGDEGPDTAIANDESLGLLPSRSTNYPDDWALYQASEVSQGEENPLPSISWFYPVGGATLDSETFSVLWNPIHGATGYRFQLDDDSNFGSPSIDTSLADAVYIAPTPVAEGTYYWRVQTIFNGQESTWSPGVEINSLVLPPPTGTNTSPVEVLAFKVLGITWQLQHKDTNMLCLAGDAETGNNAWNAPHTTRGVHGTMYCVRASIAMMASYYGGNLSQDRITYEIFKGKKIEQQLGHNVGVAAPPNPAETDALTWALGTATPVVVGKPTFAQIKTWIDADRPIMARIPGHLRVIDGYFDFTFGTTTWEFIHLLDPWDQAKWVTYADDNIAHVWVGPAGTGGAPNVKSDDDVDNDSIADTIDDSDGDGVTDFDERNRFGLIVTDPDSDGDLVNDLPDIREYVFNAAGAYTWRNPDIDTDLVRKELDPDNDHRNDNGIPDGCEDWDRDGIYEKPLGELDNFKPSDDVAIHVRLTWPLIGSDVDLHMIKPGGTYQSSSDCYYANRNPDWGSIALPCDDPNLDVDCITSCTVENIRLGKPETGTYTVRVHYYWDHDQGPTTPTVTIRINGGTPMTYGPRQISDGEVWDVATITWPTGTVALVDDVSMGSTIDTLEESVDK